MNRKLEVGVPLAISLLLVSTGGVAAERPQAEEEAGAQPTHFAAAHILIAYRGAKRVDPKVARDKREALTLAKKVAALARKAPSSFAKLARRHSDGPSAARGGDLGSFRSGQMVLPFEHALCSLRVGAISSPVETVFGYHVILRKAPPMVLAGAHILIAYKGARRARPKVTRSKKEALALATKVLAMARKAPKRFGALAGRYSDGPSASKGGRLGKWIKGRMVPTFDAAMSQLSIGAIGGPVETPFGYHLLLRDDPQQAR